MKKHLIRLTWFALITGLTLRGFCQDNIIPIINNGYHSVQDWAGALHPEGRFFVKADRTVVHAYDLSNGMLFQVFQAQCIAEEICFTPDGKFMIVTTNGEIGDACRRILVYNFYTGTLLFNEPGYPYANPAINHGVYFLASHLEDGYESTVLKFLDWSDKFMQVSTVLYQEDEDFIPLELESSTRRIMVDSVMFSASGNSVECFNVFRPNAVKTIQDVHLFEAHYLPENQCIYFTPSSRDLPPKKYNLVTGKVSDITLPVPVYDHVFFENDSICWMVDVYKPDYNATDQTGRIYVRKLNVYTTGTLEEFWLSTEPGDTDLFNQGQYYGAVYPQARALLHNQRFFIDLAKRSVRVFRTSPDPDLIHPMVTGYDPSSPGKIVINDQIWDIGKGLLIRKYPSVIGIANPGNNFDSLEWVNKEEVEMAFQFHLPRFYFDHINFADTFGYRDDFFFFHPGWDPNLATHMLYESEDAYYLLAADDQYYFLPKEKLSLARKFPKSEKLLAGIIKSGVLQKLNKGLPAFVYPAELQENSWYGDNENYEVELFSKPIRSPLLKEQYIPVCEPEYHSFKLKEEGRKTWLSTLIKPYISSDGWVMFNTINRDRIPDISYSGIIPENDVYFFDLFVPWSDNKFISLNYAFGEVKLYDEDFQLISTSSFYRDQEFIHVLPDGYYFCSKDRIKQISIRKENAVFPIEQFDLKFNRPDIVLERLGCTDTLLIKSLYRAYQKRLKRMGFSESMLKDDFHLPQLSIGNISLLPAETEENQIDLMITIADSLYSLNRIMISVNDVPIFGSKGLPVENQREFAIKVPLLPGPNRISASVLNDAGVESIRQYVTIERTPGAAKPRLVLISLGISKYMDSRFNLTYAAKDAEDIGRAFTDHGGNFSSIEVITLKDEALTREKVLSIRETLMELSPGDIVIMTYSGHGILDHDLNYFLATYDVDFHAPAEKGLPFEALEALFDGIPPMRKVLMVDACHSGELDKEEMTYMESELITYGEVKFRDAGTGVSQNKMGLISISELMNQYFLDLRRGTGATIITSAGGAEYAMESGEWNNGLFTYCFLNGLQEKLADMDGDGQVSFSEIGQYVQKEVENRSCGQQKPQYRMVNPQVDFILW